MKTKFMLCVLAMILALALGCQKEQPVQNNQTEQTDGIPVWLTVKGKVILDNDFVVDSPDKETTVLLPKKYWARIGSGNLDKINASFFVYLFSGTAEVTPFTLVTWYVSDYGNYTSSVSASCYGRIGVSQNNTETNDCFFLGDISDYNGLSPWQVFTPIFYLDAQTGYRTTQSSATATGNLTYNSFNRLEVSLVNFDDDESIFIHSADVWLTVN